MIDKQDFSPRLAVLAAATMCFLPSCYANAQSGLQVTYGPKGVQTLSYNGVVLEDVGSNGADSFHIWHMKSTDLNGNPITYGQYGWGESNNGEQWNATTNTETYTFAWGTIATQFVQNRNRLDMTVTETNFANSGIVFDGAEVYPFALHFPQDPANFYGDNQYALTTQGPGVSVADYGQGVVTSVIPNETLALYGGWKTDGPNTYSPLMTGTSPDGLPTFLPSSDLPVQPGSSLTFTVSLRFTPEGTAADASDAYASFAATYPSQMTWTDKRILGTAYLASSPNEADITQPDGYPTNPRRYFNDPGVDITNSAGLQTFQDRMLAQAVTNVTTAQVLNSQGVITWDIEGEQYAQSTSYVCSPDQVAAVAPEMESTITDPNSAFFGQKLDDAYFRTMTNAGLKVGLCLRPQVFTFGPNGTASQVYLTSNAAIIANLENKARYANGRWGATVFYVDSTVNPAGGALDPAIFQQLITDLPNFLFIPEESTPRYYAYSAPFYSFIFHTTLGTPASTHLFYPSAFGANLVNDVSPSTLAQYTPQLTAAVASGDILMGIADFWQANDPALVAIYQAAGATATTPAQPPAQPPTPAAPTVFWPAPPAISFGTALSGVQLDATASVAGTFAYSPAAGAVPSADTTTLQATFTPTDLVHYKTVTATTALTVNQVAPIVNWSMPNAVAAGTALSGAQLNATANVAGNFSYNPSAGTILSVGTTLQVTFTPNDTTDYSTVQTSVPLQVSAAAPVTPNIFWSNPAPIVYGTALSYAQLNATGRVAGSFSYSPAPGTILSAGSTQLSVTFTPADTSTYTSTSASVNLQVLQAAPTLRWNAPASIVAGTALSGTQLNATANVPGSYVYTPAAGSVPAVGSDTLQVTFTPADTTDYSVQTSSALLTVTAPAPANVNVALVYPVAGQTVSGVITAVGSVNLFLDSAGTFLIVDGQEVGTHRVTSGPFLYPLDTTTLTNGQHTLQLWGHDIGNNTTLSATVLITVAN